MAEMTAPSGEQIEITLGDQWAVIVEVGGGIRAYSVAGRDYSIDTTSPK